MSVKLQTRRHIGGLRDHKPKKAAHSIASWRRRSCTAARPSGLIARPGAACGGLGQRRLKLWSWARPPYAGRGLTRGGAAKRGLPRATVRWPRCGTKRTPAGCGVARCGGTRPAIRNGSSAEQIPQLRQRKSHLFFHLPRAQVECTGSDAISHRCRNPWWHRWTPDARMAPVRFF